MKRLFKHCHLHENTVVLFLLSLGIVLQMVDGSPFTIRKRWTKVWDTELPSENFSQFVQHCIKMILACIDFARCLTTYFYVVSAMLVLFCIVKVNESENIKDVAPKLMLIWLLIAGLKSIIMNFVEALTGVYVCSAFGNIRTVYVEFFVLKALEIVFAAYLWGSVLSIYYEMMRKREEKRKPSLFLTQFKRPRARSLLDESTLQRSARLNSFEFKDVPQIILQMLRREEEMSEDSLLGSGMMLASVSNFGSYDDLKTSQSLGELGLLDLKAIQVVGIEEDEVLSPQEKALRFLRLNWNDVRKAQECRRIPGKDIFYVGDESWSRIEADKPSVKKPTQRRPEIVLQGVSSPDIDYYEDLDKKESKQGFIELKLGFSLFSFIREKNELRTRDEEQLSSVDNLDEEEEIEEEEGTHPMFMSNIREEVAVNRIRLDFVSRKIKGNAYAKLYKEEYMSTIGPEVFDRATKLRKLTLLSNPKTDARPAMSLPAFGKNSYDSEETFNLESLQRVDSLYSDDIFDNTSNSLYTAECEEGNDHQADDNISNFHSLEEIACGQNQNQKATEQPLEVTNTEKLPCTDSNRTVKNYNFEGALTPEVDKCTNESIGPVKQVKQVGEVAFESPNKSDEPGKCKEENDFCYRKRKIEIRRTKTPIRKLHFFLRRPSTESENNDEDDGNDDEGCDEETSSTSSGDICSSDVFNTDADCDKNNSKKNGKPVVRWETFGSGKTRTHSWEDTIAQLVAEICTSKKKKNPNGKTDWTREIKRLKSIRCDQVLSNHSETANNETLKRAWKSKVLKMAAVYNPLIERKFETEAKTVKTSSKVLERVTALNYLKNRYLSPKTKIQKNHEPEVNSTCALVDQGRFVRNNESSNSLNLQRLRNKYYSLLKGLRSKLSTYRLPVSSSDVVATEEFGGESSDRQIVRKWLNSTFSNESGMNNSDQYSGTEGKEPSFDLSTEDSPKQAWNSGTVEYSENVDAFHPNPSMSPIVCYNQTEEDFPCGGRESEESFSLYYSKTADLASPLLDMKRFIYPDHIHYSYKHVKKKGFDVNINGGLPLLVRESLTMNNPIKVRSISSGENAEVKIVRRPMDLSFAETNAFAEWQTNESAASSEKLKTEGTDKREGQKPEGTKRKRSKKKKRHSVGVSGRLCRGSDASKRPADKEEVDKPEKLLGMYKRLNFRSDLRSQPDRNDRPPVQISSTQLHSNKGRINPSTFNPAICLNEHKTTKNEKKKLETQQERTKDMFARLEREVLFQSKTHNKSFPSTPPVSGQPS